MGYKTYPEYRDSGVQWLGEVPAHWEVKPFKRLASIRNGADYKDVADDNGNYPVYGSGGSFGKANAYLYDGESVLLGRKGTIDRPLYVNGPFWAVDTMFYTEISTAAVGRFVYYMATTIPFDLYSTNTALPSMTQEDLSGHIIASPDTQEQTTIAAFLDEKTAQIDQLIEKKTRFIELLKEKRAALITEAVTGKFDVRTGTPYSKYKDSGVEWLGEVPGHWDVKKLKRLGEIHYGLAEPPLLKEDGLPFIRATDIYRGKINSDTIQHIDPSDISWSRAYQLKSKDILVVRSGAYTGDSALIPEEWEGAIAGYDLILSVNKAIPEFIALSLLSKYVLQGQIYLSKMRAAQPHLNAEELGECTIVLPSYEEQSEIAAYLNQKTTQIDQLIEKTQHSIDLLKEKRAALITAAVTGKIDVRDWNTEVA